MNPLSQARYAARAVPRYTSYPTAPHFGAGVGPDDARGWLAALDPDTPVSVYLHVPYCRAICHYCGCHTKAALRDGPLDDYAATLIEEIGLVAAAAGKRLPVGHIHWGGGTPSLLPAAAFEAIAAALAGGFAILPGAEHAIELDPRSVTPALARTLARAGVTRASLGVQDFDATVQRAIGRIQPFEVVERAASALREAGITALNFDLMYGLPHQSEATVRRTCELAVSLDPSRIALFGYAHVPWFKKHQRLIDEAALPGAAERLRLEAIARDALGAAGYRPIGLDHFAKPDDDMARAERAGALRRNFQGYTTDRCDTLIGLGCSSIGKLPQGFVQNDADIGRYRRAVAAGRLPVVKGKALDADDRLRSDVIERLMCDYAVDLAAVAAAHDVAPEALADGIERLDELVRDGLVTVDGWRVAMTADGRAFVRLAAAAFDAYLARAAARHSVAV